MPWRAPAIQATPAIPGDLWSPRPDPVSGAFERRHALDRSILLAALPDVPRWIEARHLLASETARVAVDPRAPAPAFVVADPWGELAAVVGLPAPELIRTLAGGVEEVLAWPENIDHVQQALPDHAADLVHVHVLAQVPRLSAPIGRARLIRPRGRAELPGAPRELAEELLEVVRAGIPIGAAFDGDRPVAFCYPAARSGRYWDVSIDTLASHRRRGFAQAAALFMIRHMQQSTGLEAVWCSAGANLASTALAARLGFKEVDCMHLLSAPGVAA